MAADAAFGASRTGEAEVFWLVSGWRRRLRREPPELVEDLVRQFLDEPTGWRQTFDHTAHALEQAVPSLSSSGGTRRRHVNRTAQRLASLLRVLLDNLDSPVWLMGREDGLSSLAREAQELRHAFAAGDSEAALETMDSILSSGEALCQGVWLAPL
uniref:Uncharacterized protein n=1 Tax=Alexandrium catenella TaxID=2925 RepID=A0A7S1WB66_ALECA